MIYTVTPENINELLEGDEPVVLDFYASWCGPCKMLAPILENLSQKLEGQVKIGKVDADAYPQLSTAYEVTNLPTLLLVKEGHVVGRSVGMKPLPMIESFVLS